MFVHSQRVEQTQVRSQQAGFSLLEMLASTAILLVIASVVMSAIMRMTRTQGTISNRTEMHSSVRSATELLQQEIGQAGRVALPSGVTLSGAVLTPGAATVGVSNSGAASMFVGEQLTVDTGATQETVALTAVNTTSNQITATFQYAHLTGAPVMALGAFPSGIVPTTATNGSTGSLLKMYGDINGDGSMVYVEYKCDTAAGILYRNTMSFSAAAKPALTSANILLPNILANPGNTACFTYQQKTVGADSYVINVAVTLTVQTQSLDPQTNQFQQETKALLNVSPRNVFEGWQLASGGITTRLQPMPASVTNLLP